MRASGRRWRFRRDLVICIASRSGVSQRHCSPMCSTCHVPGSAAILKDFNDRLRSSQFISVPTQFGSWLRDGDALQGCRLPAPRPMRAAPPMARFRARFARMGRPGHRIMPSTEKPAIRTKGREAGLVPLRARLYVIRRGFPNRSRKRQASTSSITEQACLCRAISRPGNSSARLTCIAPRWPWCSVPGGCGKSYLSALDTHLTSHCQVVATGPACSGAVLLSPSKFTGRSASSPTCQPKGGWAEGADPVKNPCLSREAHYENGSEVSILAASSTSVRGPHVPSLKLDEVDEIDHRAFRGRDGDVHGPDAGTRPRS